VDEVKAAPSGAKCRQAFGEFNICQAFLQAILFCFGDIIAADIHAGDRANRFARGRTRRPTPHPNPARRSSQFRRYVPTGGMQDPINMPLTTLEKFFQDVSFRFFGAKSLGAENA